MIAPTILNLLAIPRSVHFKVSPELVARISRQLGIASVHSPKGYTNEKTQQTRKHEDGALDDEMRRCVNGTPQDEAGLLRVPNTSPLKRTVSRSVA